MVSLLLEKKLTAAEKKKKEEIVLAIKRDNPNMPKDQMYAIATATAKRVAESDMNENKKLLLGKGVKEEITNTVDGGAAPVSKQEKDELAKITANIADGMTIELTREVPRRVGRSIVRQTINFATNPINAVRLVGIAKTAGLAAIPVSVALALAVGGTFAWRKFVTQPKHRKIARLIANDKLLSDEIIVNTKSAMKDMPEKDEKSMKGLISSLEKKEIKSGIVA